MPRPIDLVVIHQTDTPTATVESIRRYHMTPESEGGPAGGPWSDIGYHYVIYRDGSVHTGRPEARPGSHCQGDNAHSIGICLVGKGPGHPEDIGAGYLTVAQWHALLELVERKLRQYRLRRAAVVGHRERPSGQRQRKSCPGFDGWAVRDEMRKRGHR